MVIVLTKIPFAIIVNIKFTQLKIEVGHYSQTFHTKINLFTHTIFVVVLIIMTKNI